MAAVNLLILLEVAIKWFLASPIVMAAIAGVCILPPLAIGVMRWLA